MRTILRSGVLTAYAALAAAAPLAAHAQAADPAAGRVTGFYATLLDTMKGGKSLGFAGRARRLQPAVEQTFNLPYMVFLTVGPSYQSMSAADKASIVAAFTRYTVASYAHNFDSYDGQKLAVDPGVLTRGPDKLVKTRIVSGSDTTPLDYRMRESGGSWKVIDVIYNSISPVTTQRSDFSASVAQGGASALVKKLDTLTAKLK